MQAFTSVVHLAAGLLATLAATVALAQAPCRIAYDMGSSGIRASMSGSSRQARVEIDYLAPLLAGRGLEETVAPTAAALRALPLQAGFDAACARVGGGFSAWRLALENNRAALVGELARIHQESGVAVLVMPQQVEGAYAYLSAQEHLGTALLSSHILDIGGGSLQLAGLRHTFGDTLGQKTWHHDVCLAQGMDAQSCVLQPMDQERLQKARRVLAERLQKLPAALPEPVSLTAISRPVTQGVAPAVAQLNGAAGMPALLRLGELSLAIELLAPLSVAQAAAALQLDEKYAGYLLSDMLLVEGILRATGNRYLRVAPTDLNNATGMLADDTAYAWAAHYACYLQRLSAMGQQAYASDVATCAAAP